LATDADVKGTPLRWAGAAAVVVPAPGDAGGLQDALVETGGLVEQRLDLRTGEIHQEQRVGERQHGERVAPGDVVGQLCVSGRLDVGAQATGVGEAHQDRLVQHAVIVHV